jgi:CMP/dCMP kinase
LLNAVTMLKKKLIIAVDGYSSCGKSTFARMIAEKFGYLYIDSGAMYRAVTLFCLNNNLINSDTVDTNRLFTLLGKLDIDFRRNKQTGKYETWLNSANVEKEIREPSVADKVSLISRIPEVRNILVKIQRKFGRKKGIVMDGRDIGTVVFPDADLKIFMTADASVRANRRLKELLEKGMTISYNEVLENIQKRDSLDENRKISPLRKADDALILDNSSMTPEEQMDWVMEKIGRK